MSKVVFYRLPAVCERYGCSKSSIYRQITSGDFPPPVNIGARAVAWPEPVLEKHDAKLLKNEHVFKTPEKPLKSGGE